MRQGRGAKSASSILTFYIGFAAAQSAVTSTIAARRATCARLIEQLQRERVEGIVIDLRQNGGGSLREAVRLTKLFIADGPVVPRVRDAGGKVQVEKRS